MNSLLITHFNELRRLFFSSQKNLGKKISPKRVHTFRVTIKRIRTFLLLTEFLSKGKTGRKKNTRQLKRIFDKAGRLRAFHVHDSLLKKFIANANTEQLLVNDSSRFAKKFKTALSKFDAREIFNDIEKSIKKIQVQHDREKLEKLILKFSERMIDKSIRSRKQNFHKARIQLKRAHYVLEIFGNRNRSAKEIIAIIDPVEKKLGLWQDWDEVIRAVNTASAVEKSKEMKVIQQKLSGDFLREKNRLEPQLIRDFTRLEKIFSSAHPRKAKSKKPK